VEIMAHGYTNHTARSGQLVTKAYQGPGAALRRAREAAALTALTGRLPVPALIGTSDLSLDMTFISGAHGQDLIDLGLAHQVLSACGRMLRRVHAIDPVLVQDGDPYPPGAVLVHGDYGPNNTLLDPEAHEVTAIVDWEWAHAGNPIEDLAWCEWIIRMHHPDQASDLDAFFDAYEHRPAWTARQETMVARCREMLEMCEQWEPGEQAAERWRHRLMITESWTE
jgi:aminoglycoside phosphotransferase (APT) family kinase protein